MESLSHVAVGAYLPLQRARQAEHPPSLGSRAGSQAPACPGCWEGMGRPGRAMALQCCLVRACPPSHTAFPAVTWDFLTLGTQQAGQRPGPGPGCPLPSSSLPQCPLRSPGSLVEQRGQRGPEYHQDGHRCTVGRPGSPEQCLEGPGALVPGLGLRNAPSCPLRSGKSSLSRCPSLCPVLQKS